MPFKGGEVIISAGYSNAVPYILRKAVAGDICTVSINSFADFVVLVDALHNVDYPINITTLTSNLVSL